MDTAAVIIAILALLFTVFSFWWMNWRKGSLRVGAPRSFVATGSEGGKLVVVVPLVFYNDGPVPIVVSNLRLGLGQDPKEQPLRFIATVQKLGTVEERAFATQFPVAGGEAIQLICEFQRDPGHLLFVAGKYPAALQAQLDRSLRWQVLCTFDLNIESEYLPVINSRFVVCDNYLK